MIEEKTDPAQEKTAGNKARIDIEKILIEDRFQPLGITAPQMERRNSNRIRKILFHYEVKTCWTKSLSIVKTGDSVFLQLPLINHTVLFHKVITYLHKRNVHVYGIIHDLELFRYMLDDNRSRLYKIRTSYEERNILKLLDGIVVHNEQMKKVLYERMKIPMSKMVSLGIFDYLIPELRNDRQLLQKYAFKQRSVVIAGNLSHEKSSYVYKLPSSCRFDLYGPNYKPEAKRPNVEYHGAFLPDDLPNNLAGMFGLVWDGNSIETCEGMTGEYLKINNPHKVSLYLSSGIPVVIWEKAALSDFILKNNAGITIGSLNKLGEKIEHITEKDYLEMVNSIVLLSRRLRNGEFTKASIDCVKKCNRG